MALFDWVQISAGKISKWLFGGHAESRADFAAVTDEIWEYSKTLKQSMAEERLRTDVLEERMDRNRERYLKILDELMEVKLKMSELVIIEGECQKHLVTTKDLLTLALEELSHIKKGFIK